MQGKKRDTNFALTLIVGLSNAYRWFRFATV